MTEKTAAKLAEMLMEKDPHKVAAAVKMLEDYAAEAAPKLQKLQAAETGAIGGATAAIYPSPSTGESKRDIEKDTTEFSIPNRNIDADIEADLSR
jgi:protoheme ferro-lyase